MLIKLKAFLKDIKWRYYNLGIKKTSYGTKLKIDSFMDHLLIRFMTTLFTMHYKDQKIMIE